MSNKKISMELLSCPGDTIQEWLDEQGHNKRWLAEQLGVSGNQAWRLLKGKERLHAPIAGKLFKVTGISTLFWLSREGHYRQKLARIKRL